MKVVEVTILPDGRMDVENAALYLGLRPKTLAMLRCKGNGPAFIKMGRIFYNKDTLDAWVQEGAFTSTAQARLNR